MLIDKWRDGKSIEKMKKELCSEQLWEQNIEEKTFIENCTSYMKWRGQLPQNSSPSMITNQTTSVSGTLCHTHRDNWLGCHDWQRERWVGLVKCSTLIKWSKLTSENERGITKEGIWA